MKHSLKARQAKAPKALNDQSPALCSNPMHFVTRWPIGHAHPVRFGIMEIPHITPPGKDSFILYSSNPEQHHMRNLSCVKAFTDQRDEITCPIYWVTTGSMYGVYADFFFNPAVNDFRHMLSILFNEIQGEGGYFMPVHPFSRRVLCELINFVTHSSSIHSSLIWQYNFDIILGQDSLLDKEGK